MPERPNLSVMPERPTLSVMPERPTLSVMQGRLTYSECHASAAHKHRVLTFEYLLDQSLNSHRKESKVPELLPESLECHARATYV